ncbi:MAG: PAS domain S-box protein [Candidatus Methanoperedens sp.]|nr:PAS domain S-box protein [Candidatus Methanoperedens sp.]
MNKSFKLLAIVLLVFLIGFFLEETIDSSKLSNYKSLGETVEITSELFSVFVALSIFAITWHAYNKSRDNHSLFLGTTFLIIGLLTLFHLFSYPFMPYFLTPNSTHKAAIFFLESRFILALFLLISAYVDKDSFPKLINKYVMLLLSAAILSVSLVFVLIYHDTLFSGFDLNMYSTETVILLFLITVFILVAGYLYNKRAKETFQINLNYLANGSIIVLISNLVYFSYEFSGHFLIITGFFYFYLGLYKSSVDLPYERLAISEEKLRRSVEEKYRSLFDNANDAVVTIDTRGFVTSWNKSAEKLFGWTAEEITGKKLVEVVATPKIVDSKENMIYDLFSDTITGQETTYFHRDGTKIDVSITISPLIDVNRNVAERSLIIRDITEKKKSKEALRKSEEFLRTVLNSMNDGLMVIDADDFSIVSVNSVLLKKYGLKEEEVIGKKCFEVSHKLTEPCYHRNEICPLIESVETGKYSTVEHVHFGKNGEKMFAEVSTSPIKDNTGKVVQIIHVTRDITERKQMENALHASEEKFEKAFLASPQALTITGLNDGLFIEVNDSFTKTLGYSREEALGHTTLELGIWITKEDRIGFISALQKNGFVHNEELNLRTKKGGTASMLVSAELIDVAGKDCLLTTFYDITERKRAEEALTSSLSLLNATLESTADGILVVDRNGRITRWNQKFADMWQIPEEVLSNLNDDQALNHVLHQMVQPDAFLAKVRELYRQPDASSVDQLTLTGGRIFERYSQPQRIGDDIVGRVWSFRDITKLKRDEEKIRKSLEEKEVLLREIHHRVKNNMQIVSSLLRLQSRNIEDSKYKDMFIDSQNRINSMALIHEKLYKSESIAQINFKEYINDIISNIFESYCIKSNIKIDINVENFPIKIDYAVPCGLIINELVTNSLKYAFPDGRQGKIQISLKSNENNMIRLSISDNGIGIPKDMDIRKTKSLGLHLVTALAEGQLHGEIILNRETGTEFQISFGAK